MTTHPSPPPADTSDELQSYAPLSGIAVTAFVLSLLTPASLVLPSLAIAGLLPVALGIAAAIRIRSSARKMKGSLFASGAIFIALFFVSASLAGHTLIRRHISKEAQIHFEEWVDVVAQGKLYEAYELHLQYSKRQLPGTDLDAIYTYELPKNASADQIKAMQDIQNTIEFTPKEELEIFFRAPPASTIVEHAKDAEFEFLRLEGIRYSGPDTEVTLRYRMKFRNGGVINNTEFIAILMRSKYEGGEYQWLMFTVRRPPNEG